MAKNLIIYYSRKVENKVQHLDQALQFMVRMQQKLNLQ